MITETLNKQPQLSLQEERMQLGSHFTEYFDSAGYMIHEPVPLLSGTTDPSVILIGSSTNVLKPYLLAADIPPEGIALYQPKLRQQNTRTFYTPEPNEFTSYFIGGGVLTPYEAANKATEDIMTFIETGMGVDHSRLTARINSADTDLIQLWADTGVKLELDGLDPDYYRWQFGIDELKGRGMMLAIDNDGIPGEFSSVVVIEKDGEPIGYEWGYGTETTLAKKYNLRHPICATPMADIMPQVLEDDAYTKLADAILTSAAFIHEGILPGSMGDAYKGANTVFVRYLQAVNVFSRELGISQDQVDSYMNAILRAEFPHHTPETLAASRTYLERLRTTNDRFTDVLERFANGDTEAIIELKNVKFELEKTGKVNLPRLIQEYRYQQFPESRIASLLRERGLLQDGQLIV